MLAARALLLLLCPLAGVTVLPGCGDGPARPGDAAPGAAEGAADRATPRTGPVRVLVLSGGGYHQFRGNLDLLLPALAARGPFDFTEVALGPGAPGGPPPEPSAARALLESPDLRGRFDVVLAYTQGELGLSRDEHVVLLRFVREGGGFVALHCAVDSHPGWSDYVELCGGRFLHHPPFGTIAVRVDDATHRVTAGIAPAPAGADGAWELRDEFYHLQDWVPGAQSVLMSGVSPEGGERRPVTWVKNYGAGRVAATILGHGPEVHGDARYQQLVAQALLWAAGR